MNLSQVKPGQAAELQADTGGAKAIPSSRPAGQILMKAIHQQRYGSPDDLQITEIAKPSPRDNTSGLETRVAEF